MTAGLPAITQTRTDSGIAVIRLDRERVLNAMNEAMVDELEQAIDRLAADPSVRAVVFTGTGRAFCVGSDLKEGGNHDPDVRVRRMHALMLRLARYPKVTVCAINGLALGGGLELALACNFRVAAPDARLGLPEVTHGLMPAYGGTQFLPRLVGLQRALDIALSGDMIDASRALAIGLVDEVANDPLAAAIRQAERCSAGGATARSEILQAMLAGIGQSLEDGLELERRGVEVVSASAEAQAGIADFRKGSHSASAGD